MSNINKRRKVIKCKESVGICVVFNCKYFSKPDTNEEGGHSDGTILKTRHGTEQDSKMIQETFSEFNFDVVTIDDPTDKEIAAEMKRIRNKKIAPYQYLNKLKFFICFILSHGSYADIIKTSNNKQINLNDAVIEELHAVTDLKSTNKIIVVQTCRGDLQETGAFYNINEKEETQDKEETQEKEETQKKDKTQETDETQEKEKPQDKEGSIASTFERITPITTSPRFFILFATTPGYVSYRSDIGTIFIHMLCEMLKEHRSYLPLSELAQRLIFVISRIPIETIEKKRRNWFIQIPNFFSTLQSPLILHETDFEGKSELDNEIQDKLADGERQKIFEKLQDLVNKQISYSKFPVVEDRNFLLLAEQTTGSYNMQNDMTRLCIVFDIRISTNRYKSANDDCELIEITMRSLGFDFKLVTWKDNDDKTEEREIDVENSMSVIENICCLVCFIQHDGNESDQDLATMTKIIGITKKTTQMIGIPKVFIFQPYKPSFNISKDRADEKDGDSTSNKSPVRISKESDVLLIFSSSGLANDQTLTSMFCNTLLQQKYNCSVIDLLEGALLKEWENKWENSKPSFSSTLRKHLVFRQKNQSDTVEDNETETEQLQSLRNFKATIDSDIQTNNRGSNHPQVTETDTAEPQQITEQKPLPIKRVLWISMIVAEVLLMILYLIGFFLDLNGYMRKQDCNDNSSIAINTTWTCGRDSRRISLLVLDLIGLCLSNLITVICWIGYIKLLRNKVNSNGLKKLLFSAKAMGCWFLTLNLFSCVVGIFGIVKREEYNFTNEFCLSASIVAISVCAFLMLFFLFCQYLIRRMKKAE